MNRPVSRRVFVVTLLVVAMLSGTWGAIAQDGGKGHPFAPYNLGDVRTTASIPPYSTDATLANVTAPATLTQAQREFLARNLFVVSPSDDSMFYMVYEKARYGYQPLYITVDSMLNAFHMAFENVLKQYEYQFGYDLARIDEALLNETAKLYEALRGTPWEAGAFQAAAYFGVGLRLLVPSAPIPAFLEATVMADVNKALAAQDFSASAVFPALEYGEDWTQYKPRGHYTSEQLQPYFRAMMWHGRLTFRLSVETETQAALLTGLAFRRAGVSGSWQTITDVINFFIGESDDLSLPQYFTVMDQVYGPDVTEQILVAQGVAPFVEAAKALPSPRILNSVIDDQDDIDEATKGLRFMGQRFVWDAYVFRNLIYRNVGTAANGRKLPMALDVFAALGSERALALLDEAGATKFENYLKQMEKVRAEVASVSEEEWTATVYNAWLTTLREASAPAGVGYPSFMQNVAFTDRMLFSALGSFAELKHDTVLYAEQAYAEMGGGGGKSPPPAPIPPPNFVEPLPLVWARLAALAEMAQAGIVARTPDFNPLPLQVLTEIAVKSRQMQRIAEAELNGETPAEADTAELRFYGGWLESVYNATRDDAMGFSSSAFYADEKPRAALVTDVATDPDTGQVLQLGTGNIFNIYVVVPVNGELYLARGGVYSFYEFPQPMNDRLTDEQWYKMIDAGELPPLPAWTASFLSENTVNAELTAGIRNFQSNLIDALWWEPDYSLQRADAGDLSPNSIDVYTRDQLVPLVENGQYEGRQMLSLTVRSFDLADPETAVVTTREVWRGELWDLPASGDTFADGTKVAERGPYTIDVTYTLRLQVADYPGAEPYWLVKMIVTDSLLPDWGPLQ